MTIELRPDEESALRDIAARVNCSPEELVLKLTRRAIDFRRRLDEIAGPIEDEMVRLGITEEEMVDLFEEEKHAARRERAAERLAREGR